MKSNYEIAVIGAGTMGSAAAYHLASRGHDLVAFEQFNIVHDNGSHSGATRIIRHAYHESPFYVPLVLRADELWQEIERRTNTKMLIRTGAVVLGLPESDAVRGAILACQRHSLPHEILTAAEVRQRWPQFRIPSEWACCFDPMAGFLLVDVCIRSLVQLASQHGALILEKEPVLEISAVGNGFSIQTKTNRYSAEKLVVTAGAWTAKLLSGLNLPLTVKRRTLSWLSPRTPESFELDKFPIFLADVPDGLLYGFPIYGRPGVKIANHHSRGTPEDPDSVNREYSAMDAGDVLRFAGEYLPDLSDQVLEGKVCLYNLTPDEDFIVDLHPEHRNIAIGAGFSGHGFKFATVIGEILADLCERGKTRHAIDRFRIDRF